MLTCCASPGLQSGGAGFQARGNTRYINFGALALVAASRAIPTFSAVYLALKAVPSAAKAVPFLIRYVRLKPVPFNKVSL